MMNVGEALAALGYNTWVSIFCPFFDWRVMRRIAIGYQERREVIESGGWLSDGHNLDLTFLATAPNFETRTNGSMHMGNDDSLVFSEIAQVRIVDISCPNQLMGFMKWVMEGNRGLVYARIMRAASAPSSTAGTSSSPMGQGTGSGEGRRMKPSSSPAVEEFTRRSRLRRFWKRKGSELA